MNGLKEVKAWKRLRSVLEASRRAVGILILGMRIDETDGDRVNRVVTADGAGGSNAERRLSSRFPLLCTKEKGGKGEGGKE